jgi:murein peptide amidase A
LIRCMNGGSKPGLPRHVANTSRLGRNQNGYCGDTIDISAVLQECEQLARLHGWHVEAIPAAPQPDLLSLTRPAESGITRPTRVYISAGIHGDEPAGPLAVRQLLLENRWPDQVALWICPCLNPNGFRFNRRENPEGRDLNRQYLRPEARETASHIAWLERQPDFDFCLSLHEDWEAHGFYLYELNPDGLASRAEAILQAVGEGCPIDPSEVIEGRAAQGGLIRPGTDPRSRPDWPEAFYLVTHKTRLSYTFETPSDFALDLRVAAQVRGVNAALRFPEGANAERQAE